MHTSSSIKIIKDKLQPSDIPWLAIKSILAVRVFGNKKYGSATSFYKVEPKLHLDACIRHLIEVYISLSSMEVQNNESGLMHLEHALCDLAGVVEIIKRDQMEKDEAVYKEMIKEKREYDV